MLYMIYALDKPDALELRKANRQAHLDYVRSSGRLEFGGPLLDEADNMIGSLIVIEADSLASAQAFNADDPYTQAGVFESVTITRFKKP